MEKTSEHVELFYDPSLNRFMDNDGNVLNDLHELLEPWQIERAKKLGKENCYLLFENRNGDLIELFFPDTLGDDDMFWEIYDTRKEFGA